MNPRHHPRLPTAISKPIPARLPIEAIEALKSKETKETSEAAKTSEVPKTDKKPEAPKIVITATAVPKSPALVKETITKPVKEPIAEPVKEQPVKESAKRVEPVGVEHAALIHLHHRQKVRGFWARLKLPFQATRHVITTVSLDTWLVLFCIVLLVSTQLTLIGYNKAGLIFNIVTIFIVTVLALFRATLRKLAISLLIIPVAQMAGSTIVTHNAFQATTILYGTILLLALVYRYLFTLDEPVTATQLRWTGHFFGLPLMLIIGQLLGLTGYAFLRHHYDYTHISLPLVFAACIVFAFAEEMILRGLIQQQAARVTNPIVAILLPTSLYIVMAVNQHALLSIAPAMTMGLVLSLVYHFKHNLVLTTAVNASAKLAYVGLVATFILR